MSEAAKLSVCVESSGMAGPWREVPEEMRKKEKWGNQRWGACGKKTVPCALLAGGRSLRTIGNDSG